MSQALVVRAPRSPAVASGRLRKAAEHYVRSGCKAIGPSLIYAGYSAMTAKEPTKNGYTHDRLIQVASYWNKGSQATARSYMAKAIKTLADMMQDQDEPAAARGSAAKTIIDVAAKEKESEDTSQVSADEQAKWMALVRHWKRTFLRRGILIGIGMYSRENGMGPYSPQQDRGQRLLCSLNYALGKGPRPDWMESEEETDGEGLLGLEGDPQPGSDDGIETVEGELL